MYTILWTEGEQRRWEQEASRRQVAALLIANGLENDDSVIILTQEALEKNTLSIEDLFVSL